MKRLILAGAAVALGFAIGLALPAAALDSGPMCQAKRLRAVGKYAYCLLKAEMRAVKKQTAPDYSRCSLEKKWAKTEEPACPKYGEEDARAWFEEATEDFTGRVTEALSTDGSDESANLPFCKLPATGQTTCYAAGDDGEMQAGAALVYNDSGNIGGGLSDAFKAIVDKSTGLMWEKKDNADGLRDVDNVYCWDSGSCPGTSIWDHVDALNNTCAGNDTIDCTSDDDCAGVVGADGICGYAGFRDWRIPNIRELQSIVDYGTCFPSVAPAFNEGCTSGCGTPANPCSCTASSGYWSSTTCDFGLSGAWLVYFNGGFALGYERADLFHVRAVRGGF